MQDFKDMSNNLLLHQGDPFPNAGKDSWRFVHSAHVWKTKTENHQIVRIRCACKRALLVTDLHQKPTDHQPEGPSLWGWLGYQRLPKYGWVAGG